MRFVDLLHFESNVMYPSIDTPLARSVETIQNGRRTKMVG